jgi:hypothetical protein
MKRALYRFVLVAFCSSFAVATTVIPQSVEQLTAASTLVVSAHAERSWESWDPQHHLIYTYTVFTVTKTLAGPTLSQVLVRQMGGSLDGITQKVSGVRQFQQHEDAVLFLRPGLPDGSGALSITGLMQGHFYYVATASGVRLSNGILASHGRETVQALTSSGFAAFHGTTIAPDELEARVRTASVRTMRQD